MQSPYLTTVVIPVIQPVSVSAWFFENIDDNEMKVVETRSMYM